MLLKLYKDTRLYFIVASIGEIAVFALIYLLVIFPRMNLGGKIIFIFLELIILGIMLGIFSKIATDRYKNVTDKLHEKCDVNGFVKDMDAFLQDKNVNGNLKNTLEFNRAEAFLYNGDFEETKKVLDKLGKAPTNLSNDKFKYNFMLCSYYIQQKDIDNAKKHLEILQDMSQATSNSEQQSVMYKRGFELKQAEIKFNSNNFLTAEKDFNQVFDTNDQLVIKILAKYYLAKYYQKIDQKTKATTAFEYVARYGGDTYMQQEASDFLRKNRA